MLCYKTYCIPWLQIHETPTRMYINAVLNNTTSQTAAVCRNKQYNNIQ